MTESDLLVSANIGQRDKSGNFGEVAVSIAAILGLPAAFVTIRGRNRP